MRVVAALGGNALLRRHERAEAELQARNARAAARALAALAPRVELVVTHGNGPQVGLLALQAEAYPDVSPYPLDVLGAEAEGLIGYLLERELRSALPQREVASLLTQVEVDAGELARLAPTKPIGPIYPEAVARRLARQRGWALAPDAGGLRRVVPSPEPRRILGLAAIRCLLDAGTLVICTGGGGIPVARDAEGALVGVEAVIDKDLASARLAAALGAEVLLLVTDVDGVYRDWPRREAGAWGRVRASQLAAKRFAAGTMGPKVAAACRFAAETGGRAAIGHLADVEALLDGSAGTQVVAG